MSGTDAKLAVQFVMLLIAVVVVVLAIMPQIKPIHVYAAATTLLAVAGWALAGALWWRRRRD